MFYILRALFYSFVATVLFVVADVNAGDAFLVGIGGAMIWWGLEALTERRRTDRIFNEELNRRLDGERARILGDSLVDPNTTGLLLRDAERVADSLRKQQVQ